MNLEQKSGVATTTHRVLTHHLNSFGVGDIVGTMADYTVSDAIPVLMPKQPNGTPGNQPPAPSVKVPMGRKSQGIDDEPHKAQLDRVVRHKGYTLTAPRGIGRKRRAHSGRAGGARRSRSITAAHLQCSEKIDRRLSHICQ
jgi:hypothetical protein